MENKCCRECGLDKPLYDFSLCTKNKDGYNNFCKSCRNAKDKVYRDQNKEKISNRLKEYNAKEDVKKMRSEYARKFRQENLLEMRKKALEKQKLLRETDPFFRFKQSVRNRINNSLKHNGIRKNSKTAIILGCSFQDFRDYLESKFESWMNWDNRGLYNGTPEYGWDIDHIIPSCLAKTEEELIQLNHYSNLQPLCSYINRDIKRNNPIKI